MLARRRFLPCPRLGSPSLRTRAVGRQPALCCLFPSYAGEEVGTGRAARTRGSTGDDGTGMARRHRSDSPGAHRRARRGRTGSSNRQTRHIRGSLLSAVTMRRSSSWHRAGVPASVNSRFRTRRAGLSLGDRACLALAEHTQIPALTGDRALARDRQVDRYRGRAVRDVDRRPWGVAGSRSASGVQEAPQLPATGSGASAS